MSNHLARRISTGLVILAGLSILAPRAAAESLYVTGQARSMFADRRARAIGDVVTVLITESTVASQDAASEAQRKTESSAAGGSGGILGVLNIVPKGSLSGSTNQKGSGASSRSSRLAATITCRVVDVLPSGNLLLRGERRLKVNADAQLIRFRGMIRPDDVATDNTVISTVVADAEIEVVGKGPIDRHVKPGVLSRIFQFLF